MDEKKEVQKPKLEEIVEKFTSNTMASVTNLVGSIYKGSIETYLKSKETEIGENIKKIDDKTRQNLSSYLDFLVNSGKIYEYSFGVALKNTGYLPRTVSDIVSLKSSNQEEREKREVMRYLTKASFIMLPSEIQDYLARKSISEVQRMVSDSFEKDLIYLKIYLLNKESDKQKIEPSLYLAKTILNTFPELVSNQYLVLSKIFKPEALEVLAESTILTSKDNYKELYNIILDSLKVKEEPKKEEVESNVKIESSEQEKREKISNKTSKKRK